MFSVLDDPAMALLKWHFASGIFSASNYTGTGFFEIALHMVAQSLRSSGVSAVHVESVSASELQLIGRKSLLKLPPPCDFKHIFGDMFTQLPEVLKSEVADIEWPCKSTILQQTVETTTADVKGHIMALMRTLEKHDFWRAKSKCMVHGDGMCRIADIGEDAFVPNSLVADFCLPYQRSPSQLTYLVDPSGWVEDWVPPGSHNLSWPTRAARSAGRLAPELSTKLSGNLCKDVLDGELGTGPWAGLRLSSGGVTCLDLTQAADQLGLAGLHTKTLVLFIAERRALKEPIWIVECVVSDILPRFLNAMLGDLWDIEFTNVCPTELGYPMNRDRMWAVGTRRDVLSRTAPLSQMKEHFKRTMAADGNLYFCMDAAEVEKDLEENAKRKFNLFPEGQRATWEACLPQYQQSFLEDCDSRHVARKHVASTSPAASKPPQTPDTIDPVRWFGRVTIGIVTVGLPSVFGAPDRMVWST